jgi:threonine/homoserine/homoserine lactone efflux protein
MNYLIKGFLIGLAIAAPVGPIGILCIRRTLAEGRWTGFVSGLGAATADMFYGFVAAFGLTIIQDILISQRFWLQLIGGIFLLYMGIRTLLTKPTETAAESKSRSKGYPEAYLSTVLLTLTNPATILSFTMIFAALGFVNTKGDSVSAAFLVGGVFLGSAFWWLTLTTGVGFLRERFKQKWMVWVNRVSGLILMVFGVAALSNLL